MMAGSGEHLRQSLLQSVDEDATEDEEHEVGLLLRTSAVHYGRHAQLYATLLVAAVAVAGVPASAGLEQNDGALICNPQPRQLYRPQ